MIIKFDEKVHKYHLDGAPVPSVTQIIGATIGHGWQAEQWYLDRGKAIHACAKLISEGKKFSFEPRLSGYVAAIENFFKTVKPVLSFGSGEILVASKIFQYCGTIDLLCKIGNCNAIVDYKHSFDYERIALQLGGYAQASKETIGIDFKAGYGVQIKPDGNFLMTSKIDLEKSKREFLALRTTYKIKERCGTL